MAKLISVYKEITDFVAERDPKTIAVNYTDWLAVADSISYRQYVKLLFDSLKHCSKEITTTSSTYPGRISSESQKGYFWHDDWLNIFYFTLKR